MCLSQKTMHLLFFFISNKVILTKSINFEKNKVIEEQLWRTFVDYPILTKPYDDVIIIHDNNLNTFVPNSLFDANFLASYLQYNTKVFETDFFTYDVVFPYEMNNIYVPFININNFLLDQYETFDFKNFYAGLENPYEDLTVNTQAADFAAQQQQRSLAGTLDALRQSGGGLGAAALAQSLAQVQSQNLQQASASIAQQEQANAMAAAQGAMQAQMAEAGGAANVQGLEFGRTETLLGMSQQRKRAADEARQKASSAFFGGLGNIAGSVAAFGLAGGFEEGAFKD